MNTSRQLDAHDINILYYVEVLDEPYASEIARHTGITLTPIKQRVLELHEDGYLDRDNPSPTGAVPHKVEYSLTEIGKRELRDDFLMRKEAMESIDPSWLRA